MKKINAAIVGARGYGGLELANILLSHPRVQLTDVYSSNADWLLSDDIIDHSSEDVQTKNLNQLEKTSKDYDVVFFATSASMSYEWIPKIHKNCKVIDLSGAFRLDEKKAKEYYGLELDNEWSRSENYGLVPFNTKIRNFVSNPGCYVTATLMAIIPLLKAGILNLDTLVIDAKSGTTGAGRSPKDSTNFSEISDDLHPYKIASHQHFPEIVRYAKEYGDAEIDPHFTTTLVPLRRGILSSIYCRLKKFKTQDEIYDIFSEAYKTYPLVDIHMLSETELGYHWKLSLKRVLKSPYTQISFYVDGDKLYLYSFIDNLMKGAASQAVENLNLIFDMPIETGLTRREL